MNSPDLPKAPALAIALAAAATVLLASAFLIGSSPDEEEFRFAILSAWLRIRSLGEGSHGLWTPLLGLGSPQPFVPNFCLHPLAPLLAFMPPAEWIRLMLLAHTLLGAAGMWRLGTVLNLTPLVRGACTATFLLATPVQNYLLTDFWPSHYVVWTFAPWIVLLAWKVLDPATPDVRRSAVGLGLTTGLVAASTNPGHMTVYLTVIAAFAIAHRRAGLERWAWLAAAAAIAAAVASPVTVQLATERRLIAAGHRLSNLPNPLPISELRTLVLAPLVPLESTRTVFFGGPFAALGVAGCLWLRHRRSDIVLGFVLSALVVFTAWVPVPFTSARYQFRDPLTLCGIVLAGLVATDLMRTRARVFTSIIVLVQLGVVTAAAWPFLAETWQRERIDASAWTGATAQTPLVDAVINAMRRPGRVAYSPGVEYDVSERALVDDGLGMNALAYRNVSVVNGFFKGVSTDVLWPDERLFYGRVRVPQWVVRSGDALDLLGIRYVLAWRGEAVAPELKERISRITKRRRELVLYEHDAASNGAFLVDAAFGDRDLPVLADCKHDRLLCRDLGQVARAREPVTLRRTADTITVAWHGSTDPKVLVVAEMFRPEWVAMAGERRVATRPMYGGLLGVPLPPDVKSVRLEYRPRAAILAAALSYLTVAICLIFLGRSAVIG